jgi:ATP-binding cassette, subfamily B, multidrug efflux pump
LYLAMFYSPLQRLSDLSVVLVNALAAIERIFEYFDTQPHVAEKPNAKSIAQRQGRIEFEQVHFSYDPDTPVLQDISLTILPEETVAFVGPTGSGKSTLANLVPRFYDPTAGTLRLDGHDLKDLEIASLRRQNRIFFIGMVIVLGRRSKAVFLARS